MCAWKRNSCIGFLCIRAGHATPINSPLTPLGLRGPSWEGFKEEEFGPPVIERVFSRERLTGSSSPTPHTPQSPKLLASGLSFTQQNKQLSSLLSATSKDPRHHETRESNWDPRSPPSGLETWLCDPASSPGLCVTGSSPSPPPCFSPNTAFKIKRVTICQMLSTVPSTQQVSKRADLQTPTSI